MYMYMYISIDVVLLMISLQRRLPICNEKEMLCPVQAMRRGPSAGLLSSNTLDHHEMRMDISLIFMDLSLIFMDLLWIYHGYIMDLSWISLNFRKNH